MSTASHAFPALKDPETGFLDSLRGLLDTGGVVAPEDAPGYFEEPRKKHRGRAAAILRPTTVEQVSEILRRCNEAKVGVLPYAGGTGLVGGQLTLEGATPIVLSVERMTKIRKVDVEDDALICEAGCVLADIQAAADEAGRLFPLSLAAEGSCRVGGNLATNAGGVTVVRYGSARDLCLGVEAVLADGSIYRGLKTLRKDNTGYDLRNLLIGSEGTLGVITAACLKLYPKPRDVQTALVAIQGPRDAVRLLRALQARLGETVSAFELISNMAVDFVLANIEGVRYPLAQRHPFYALIEVAGTDMREPFLGALAAEMESGLAQDAAIAENEAQRQELWRLREEIPTANHKIGALSSHDVSVPISHVPEMVEDTIKAVAEIDPGLRLNVFGHIGDGNLHCNAFAPKGADRAEYLSLAPEIMAAVHEVANAHGGSFSAEHGVGRLKREDLIRFGDPTKLAMMRAIKAALDPNGVLNPGAVLAPGSNLGK